MLHTAADGNGPVNALDSALRKALGAFYPVLDGVHLVDYKVRILDGVGGHRGADAGGHHVHGRRARVVDDGLGHQHHRGLRGGAERLAGVRHLEDGRGTAATWRAPFRGAARQVTSGDTGS